MVPTASINVVDAYTMTQERMMMLRPTNRANLFLSWCLSLFLSWCLSLFLKALVFMCSSFCLANDDLVCGSEPAGRWRFVLGSRELSRKVCLLVRGSAL